MAGLYIHVPFCRAKCAYCDFYSLPRLDEFAARYVDALAREWSLRQGELTENVTSLYFGGGTPSSLSAGHIARLSAWLPLPADGGEFTVEFNPEDVNVEKLKLWKDLGANRISMGVQSLNDEELKAVGRRHTAAEAISAAETLMQEFDNVSMDLIIGLPGQTVESLTRSLTRLTDLRPAHLSVYILSYEEGTRLWAMRKTGKIMETDDDTIVRMYDTVCGIMAKAGYEHYEISNFALPGRHARHNSAYWADRPYLGLGPAAHSFDGTVRRANPGNIRLWLERLEADMTACEVEEETETDRINDRIMVNLRTARGLDLEDLPPHYRVQIEHNLSKIPAGRIVRKGSTITIPERGWLVSDATISDLFI